MCEVCHNWDAWGWISCLKCPLYHGGYSVDNNNFRKINKTFAAFFNSECISLAECYLINKRSKDTASRLLGWNIAYYLKICNQGNWCKLGSKLQTFFPCILPVAYFMVQQQDVSECISLSEIDVEMDFILCLHLVCVV